MRGCVCVESQGCLLCYCAPVTCHICNRTHILQRPNKKSSPTVSTGCTVGHNPKEEIIVIVTRSLRNDRGHSSLKWTWASRMEYFRTRPNEETSIWIAWIRLNTIKDHNNLRVFIWTLYKWCLHTLEGFQAKIHTYAHILSKFISLLCNFKICV